MKEWLKGFKLEHLFTASLCIILGILLIVWPMMSITLLCIILGCILLIFGISHIIDYVKRNNRFYQIDLIVGIIFSVVGIWIVIKPNTIITLVPIVFGLILLVHAFQNLQQALHLKKVGYENWKWILIIAIATLLLGIFMLLNPFGTVKTLMIFIGIGLVFDGISDIFIISHIAKANRVVKEALTSVEVKAEVIEEEE